MSKDQWHAFAVRIWDQTRIPRKLTSIGECRRAQLSFNRHRIKYLKLAIELPNLFPDNAVQLYEPLATEIDRPSCTIYYCRMAPSDQWVLNYIKDTPDPSPIPFEDLQKINGLVEHEKPLERPVEKPIWDPT
jgi:hypothetical protein